MSLEGVDALVAAIGEMPLDALRQLWRERYGAPPSLRSVPILRMLLAWRVQAEASGGLDRATRRALERTGRVSAQGQHLGIGAVLTRNWQGRSVTVTVEQDGFRYQGKT